MDKVIIDGVDVSECIHLKECKDRKNPRCLIFDEKCHRIGFTEKCEDICYYKQLQRARAEIEELKIYIESNKQQVEEVETLVMENAELKAENEKLKENNKYLENRLQLRMASDKESDKYWDDIFNKEDYPFNKENVYKELSDYYFVLNQIPKIYMEITGGTLSKTTYFASSVIEAYNDALYRYYDEIDDLEFANNKYSQCLKEIKEIVFQAESKLHCCCDITEMLVNIEDKIAEVK